MVTRGSSFGIPQMVELASKVEESGFSGIFVGDNVLTLPRPDPLTLLASIAMIARNVSLGTCVMIFPLRHPILLAQQTATLDQISNGRLILMAGIGGSNDPREKRKYER